MGLLVAGVDSSTQACKVLVCEAGSGRVVRSGRAAHPDGTEVDPAAWWRALREAAGGLLDGVAAIAVAAQQHGLVALDGDGVPVRPALLWNDTRAADAAAALVAEGGGAAAWAGAVGSVPLASFTVSKLRWLAEHEPAAARRVDTVVLPHDHLTGLLVGDPGREPSTDRGDASGTGYWSPATGEYRHDLVRLAFGRAVRLPVVSGPAEAAGHTPDGVLVAAGTGDNMGAALGLGLAPGDVVMSVGTSGTVFVVAERASADPAGAVAGFADATGRYLPLVCTLNAARVLGAAAGLLGVGQERFDELALAGQPGAGGLTLLPYLDGERTPNLPAATGLLAGLTRGNATPQNLARAAVEGMLGGLADGLDALRAQGVPVRRVLLIGGGARSAAVRAVAPALLGLPVAVPAPAEYVALGAARQAAWALSGRAEPPEWRVPDETVVAEPSPAVRERYARIRDGARSLLSGPPPDGE